MKCLLYIPLAILAFSAEGQPFSGNTKYIDGSLLPPIHTGVRNKFNADSGVYSRFRPVLVDRDTLRSGNLPTYFFIDSLFRQVSIEETDPLWSAEKYLYLTIADASVNYEPAFLKNTAFNKNFGTSPGSVAEGDDSRIINGQTAYSWGNHADEGYLKSFSETDPVSIWNQNSTAQTGNFWINGAGRIANLYSTKIIVNNADIDNGLGQLQVTGNSYLGGDVSVNNLYFNNIASTARYIYGNGSQRYIRIPGTGGNAHWRFGNTVGFGIEVYDETIARTTFIAQRDIIRLVSSTNVNRNVEINTSTNQGFYMRVSNEGGTALGQSFSITAGSGSNTGNGGDLYLSGGNRGNSGTTDGNVFLSPTVGNVVIGNTSNNGPAKLQVNGSMLTSAPTGSTARPFKIGDISTVSPTSANRTLAVEINGTTYYLPAKTTND